jgi:hypothetical protein
MSVSTYFQMAKKMQWVKMKMQAKLKLSNQALDVLWCHEADTLSKRVIMLAAFSNCRSLLQIMSLSLMENFKIISQKVINIIFTNILFFINWYYFKYVIS